MTMLAPLVVLLSAQTPLETPKAEVVTLQNGMRWVLLSRPDEGLVAGVVVVRAGSVDEREGETGSAHMLEHLAFKGTPIVGNLRGWRVEQPLHDETLAAIDRLALLEAQGQGASPEARTLATRLEALKRDWGNQYDEARFTDALFDQQVHANAWTTKDSTTYFGEFPSEQVGFWLAAEAQRFAAPVFREFLTERGTVLQELKNGQHRGSGDQEALLELAFEGTGYAWPTIGREADVRVMSPTALSAFYERHYSASNAVGALVGEFDVAAVTRQLERTFGQLPQRATPQRPRVQIHSPTKKRKTLKAGDDPRVLVAFKVDPRNREKEEAMFTLLNLTLVGSSWESGAVRRPTTFLAPGDRDTYLIGVTARLRPGARMEDATAQLLDLFAHVPLDEQSIARASRIRRRQRLEALQTRRQLAEVIAQSLLFSGSWNEAFTVPTVTLQTLQEAQPELAPEKAWVLEFAP